MDASQALSHIHWIAVLVAAIVGFPLGALWYGFNPSSRAP
jgi:hypothetical protein